MKKILFLLTFLMVLPALISAQTTIYSQNFSAVAGYTLANGADPVPTSANTWIDNGSGFAYINADGSNQINNIMTTTTIPIAYPPQGAVYDFKFSWYMANKDLFHGTGTDPLLGPVDATDVVVKYYTSTNGGSTWSSGNTIWLDDTVNFNAISSGFYYARTFRLAVASSVNAIKADFQYIGKNGSQFRIDNVQLVQTDNAEFVFMPKSPFDNNQVYSQIPLKQVKDYRNNLGLTIKNNGITAFADAQLDIFYNTYSFYYDYVPIVQADFGPSYPSSRTYNVTAKSVGKTVYPNALGGYYLDYSTSVNGNGFFRRYSFSVTDSVYAVDNGANGGSIPYTSNSGSVGHIYQVVNPAKLTTFSVKFTNDGTLTNEKFTYSLYKIGNIADSSSLTLVYQSGDLLRGNGASWLTVDIPDQSLTAGYYLALINQVGTTNLKIQYDTDGDGSFLRYNASAVKKVFTNASDPKRNAAIRLNFFSSKPSFVTTQTDFNNAKPIAGKAYSFTIKAKDPDGDAFQLVLKPNASGWLQTWYTFTDNGNGTATLSGTPVTNANDTVWVVIKQNNVRLDSSLFKLAAVLDNYPATLTYNQFFTAAAMPIDWADERYIKSNNHWAFFGSYASTSSDTKDTTQNEILISPAFELKGGADTNYRVKFRWMVSGVSSFLGGDLSTLGSFDPIADDYNNGDLNLRISTLESGVWSAWSPVTLWEEDDSAKLVATSNQSGYKTGSVIPYPYANGNLYYTQIDITKKYPQYKGKKVRFAFEYKAIRKWATAPSFNFYLDEFIVDIAPVTTDLEVKAIKFFDNEYIPTYQMVNYPVKAVVKNIGNRKSTATFLAATVDSSGYDIYSDKIAVPALNGGDSVVLTMAKTFSIKGAPSYQGYTVTFDLNPASENEANGGNDLYSYVFYTSGPSDNDLYFSSFNYSNGIYMNDPVKNTNRIGTRFSLNKDDYFSGVYLNFYDWNDWDAEYSYTILKNSVDNTSGTVVYTSPQYRLWDTWVSPTLSPEKPVLLTAGTYTLVVNQLDPLDGLAIYRDNKTDGYFVRVTDDNKMWKDTLASRGFLQMQLFFENDAPSFLTSSSDANLTKATVGLAYSFNVVAQDDFNKYAFSTVVKPSWLSLSHDGTKSFCTISGTPTANALGANEVRIKVKDDRGNESILAFFINVSENPVPVFTSTPLGSAKEGVAYSYAITANDEFGDALTLTAEQKPAWLTFTANNANKSATLTGTPAAGDVGTATVQLKVVDANGKQAYQLFNIVVAPASTGVVTNTAPKFTSASSLSATQGVAFTHTLTATDANGDAVTFLLSSLVSKPSWISLSGSALSGTPGAENVGENRVIVIATDGKAKTEQVLNISVKAANTVPVFSSTAGTNAEEGVAYVYNITTTDANGDALQVASKKLPVWLVLSGKGNGKAVLSGTPRAEHVGANAVILTVSDGFSTVEQSFTITVAAMQNAAPAFSSQPDTTARIGELYSYTITASDADGQALRFSARDLPAWLSMVDKLNGTAVLSGTPAAMHTGTVMINLTVTDGKVVVDQKFELVVSETGLKSAVSIYPNPSEGEINLINVNNSKVYIYNSNGKLMETYTGNGDLKTIDLSRFQNGLYYVKVIDAQGVITQKVITLMK